VSDSYDSRGNVTHNGIRSFKYNPLNHMTESDGNSYLYDGFNRRVKTIDSNGTSYSMYSQAGKLLYRETKDGGINYIFLGDKLIAKEGMMPVKTNSRMHYKPFGDSIEAPKDDVGYTGHKYDTDLGWSYMQQRLMDPRIGRFMSNDPVGYVSQSPVMSFNRYIYANNNPYKYTDPNGEFAILLLFAPEIVALGNAALLVGSAALAGYAGSEAINAYNESSDPNNGILEDATPTDKKGEYTKEGGIEQAAEDFDTVTEGETKTYPNGTKVGQTADGRTVDSHGSSGKSGKGADVARGTQTTKIRNAKGKVKVTIRYKEKKQNQ
jgi:RHS repeat-associated protein